MATKLGEIESFVKTDHYFFINYKTGQHAKLYILNNHVFRYYVSPTGDFPDYPQPNNPGDVAKITVKDVVDYDKTAFQQSILMKKFNFYIIHTDKIEIHFDKIMATMIVNDKRTENEALRETEGISYENGDVTQTLYQYKSEHFFGGGMQNGRFSHKGNTIKIFNSNNWVDGGVTSPCPFYWSSSGYGVLRNTWNPGHYDFRSEDSSVVKTTHAGEYFDAFYFINEKPKDLLRDYFDLTGRPIFMPEYAFYEAHLNAFNRDFWVEVSSDTSGAILFEDGKYYKCYQPNQMDGKTGILESLNGEKDNYQFSARAMIDRYKKKDMPLGWFVPNDGYGCGYGQTDSLDGDIDNLNLFAEYSRAHGVELALWTESNLHPADPSNPKKGERDLGKEVSIAGVVALKCDVAWIGQGYSFGLNAVEDATNIFVKETKNKARPMIIMVDGWAGTQRYAGIWSGDQKGGEWEYIRFHIPTYIGTGLSGMPVIGSDMDGIYAGGLKNVNIRDFQWKTFTPLQLNMDGWGWVQKTPFAFDDEATALNRAYLKLKSMLMPYNYTIGYESTLGLPMIRAMFIEFPNDKLGYTKETQYQYMWGPSILVAPIYNNNTVDDNNSVRDGVYLPDPNQVWIDFFTGEKYQGGKVLNNLQVPIWKIPIFIKEGAILPMVNPNNNPNEINRNERIFNLYPSGKTSFEVYEDDGLSSDYLNGYYATTNVTVNGPESNSQGDLYINIHKTKGSYNNMVNNRSTLLRLMSSKDFKQIKAAINGVSIDITKALSYEEFNSKENVFYHQTNYIINPYLKEIVGDSLNQNFLLIKLHSVNVTQSDIQIKVKDFVNDSKIFGKTNSLQENILPPKNLKIDHTKSTPTSLTLNWDSVEADYEYYEIEKDGFIYTNIKSTSTTFDNLKSNSKYSFKIRSVTKTGVSKWSAIVDGVTTDDSKINVIKNVKVTCNYPHETSQETSNLTDCDDKSLWHTDWGNSGKANFAEGDIIKLEFDLQNEYKIKKIEYVPREDAGNGTILKLQYMHSTDSIYWTKMSEIISWQADSNTKIIDMNGDKVRFFKLHILDTVGSFASGKHMLFYKNDE